MISEVGQVAGVKVTGTIGIATQFDVDITCSGGLQAGDLIPFLIRSNTNTAYRLWSPTENGSSIMGHSITFATQWYEGFAFYFIDETDTDLIGETAVSFHTLATGSNPNTVTNRDFWSLKWPVLRGIQDTSISSHSIAGFTANAPYRDTNGVSDPSPLLVGTNSVASNNRIDTHDHGAGGHATGFNYGIEFYQSTLGNWQEATTITQHDIDNGAFDIYDTDTFDPGLGYADHLIGGWQLNEDDHTTAHDARASWTSSFDDSAQLDIARAIVLFNTLTPPSEEGGDGGFDEWWDVLHGREDDADALNGHDFTHESDTNLDGGDNVVGAWAYAKFFSSATSWVVVHNMGGFPRPIVTVDEEQVEAEITYDSEDQLTVRFSTAHEGRVQLS